MCVTVAIQGLNVAAVIKSHSAWAIIVACGKTEQITPEVDTAFLQIGDQPILAHSLVAFERCPEIDGIIVVAAKDRLDHIVGMARMYGTPKLKKIVGGGVQKTSSLKAALGALTEESASIVVVHEASQPCVTPEVISETIKGAKRYGVAAAAEKMDVPTTVVPKGLKAGKIMSSNTAWALEMPVAIKRDALGNLLGMGKSKVKVEEADFADKLYKGAYLVPITRPNPRIRTMRDIQMVSTAMRV